MLRRPLTLITCAAALAGTLSGCGFLGGGDDIEEVVVTVTSTRSKPTTQAATPPAPVTVTSTVREQQPPTPGDGGRAGSSGNDPLKEAFRSVLNNPTLVPFSNPSSYPINPSGNYRYTLADLNGDNRPEMLLNIGMEETGPGYQTIGYVAVVMGSSTPGNIVTAKGVTLDGAASAGGSRAATLMPTPGTQGLAEIFYYSLGEDTTNNIYSIDEDNFIVKEGEYKDTIDLSVQWRLPAPAGFCVPQWHPVSDASLVDSLSTGQCEA